MQEGSDLRAYQELAVQTCFAVDSFEYRRHDMYSKRLFDDQRDSKMFMNDNL